MQVDNLGYGLHGIFNCKSLLGWNGTLYISACISDDLHVKDCIGFKQATLVKEGT